MSGRTPRLRLFAGPNGSGKSTLKSYLPEELLGKYLNPDEIEETIRKSGLLDFALYGVSTTADVVLSFFADSPFLTAAGLSETARRLAFSGGRLEFADVAVNSYFASVASDFLQRALLEREVSFTVETVMSHPSKVQLLGEARSRGYRLEEPSTPDGSCHPDQHPAFAPHHYGRGKRSKRSATG